MAMFNMLKADIELLFYNIINVIQKRWGVKFCAHDCMPSLHIKKFCGTLLPPGTILQSAIKVIYQSVPSI